MREAVAAGIRRRVLLSFCFCLGGGWGEQKQKQYFPRLGQSALPGCQEQGGGTKKKKTYISPDLARPVRTSGCQEQQETDRFTFSA